MKRLFTLLLFLPIFLFSQNIVPDSLDEISNQYFAQQINSIFDSLNQVNKSENIDSLINRLHKFNKFNGVLLVSQDKKILYHKAFGYANWRTKAKLTTNSIFELASVSKPFTAIAILKLYEEGKLDIHDTVQKYIPCFPYKKRTIHHLLTHRAGLPDYYQFSSGYWKNQWEDMSTDFMIDILCVRKLRAKFLADAKHEYSNTGYVILAKIVEIVSGKSYGEYLHDTFFAPIGMKNTFVRKHEKKHHEANKTVGHSSGRGIRQENFLNGPVGDKGIWSTAYDMFLWNNALFYQKVIHDTTLKLAITPFNPDMSPERNYGYGFRLGAIHEGQNLVYHTGLWGGYNTLFIHRIHDKINIVVLSNVDNKSYRHQSGKWIEIIEQL
jgi:CubicO group peptidase (beta-lactamase class C family)